jgi:protein gp37
MNTTGIEGTEKTWNPIIGCTKLSAGCANCYAEVMAKRLQAMKAKGYEDGFQLKLMPDRLEQPLYEKKSSIFFVNSMSDLFHEDVPFEYIDAIIDIMHRTPQHIFQVLTKRASLMKDYFKTREVPENMWIGVTVEDTASIHRIDHLKQINASTRFLSIEPLLEDLGDIDIKEIHWVIVGGESGSRARPMKESWVLNIKRQCEIYEIPFFFKQWGAWGVDKIKRNKKANGSLLQGKNWKQFPVKSSA